jgi:hypothetical protein
VKLAILLFKKGPRQHGQENFLKNFPKNSSHLEEESYEMAKIYGGFGQISSFEIITFSKRVLVVCQHVIEFLDILLLYLSCNQIWLNPQPRG